MRKGKVMVTGGAGFIGSHLVDALLKLNMDVISIDDYSAGKHKNLEHLKGNPKFQEVDCDITDYEKLRKYMNDVAVIFHNAASKKNICDKDPRRDLAVNAEGTFNILELARDFKVEKVVHASTGSVYGEGGQKETDSLSPVSYYGVSKLAGERYALAFSKLYDMDITVLRYFHVYGPRQGSGKFGGVISIFADKILKDKPITVFGDGTQERSFTYVDDVVRANLFVASSKKTKGQVYNCASGLRIKLNDMISRLANITQKNIKVKYGNWLLGDIRHFSVDNSKLTKLGFKFNTKLNDGLRKVIDYFTIKSPFHTKHYDSYDDYLNQQGSKYDKKNELNWFDGYEQKYKILLGNLLNATKIDFNGKVSLSIGARQGTEVEVFREHGSFAVGIDLNTGTNNKWVVTGDGSDIQYPDNSVDVVYTNALDHFLKIDKTLSEIKRVLKDKGRFIFLIGSPEDSKNDKWGSTYWDDTDSVIQYIEKKYGFTTMQSCDVQKTNWFYYFYVMQL